MSDDRAGGHGPRLPEYVTVMVGESGDGMSRMRLHSTFFMLGKTIEDIGSIFDFVPGPYGPHSEKIDSAVSLLVKDKILELSGEGYGSAVRLTERGRREHDKSLQTIELWLYDRICSYVARFGGMENDEILALTCARFPEMAAKSDKYNDKLSGHLATYMINLVIKSKLSIQEAADLSGAPYMEVWDAIKFEESSAVDGRDHDEPASGPKPQDSAP